MNPFEEARKKRKLSRRQMGILVGISSKSAAIYWYRYETGRVRPSPEVATRIENEFGIPIKKQYEFYDETQREKKDGEEK